MLGCFVASVEFSVVIFLSQTSLTISVKSPEPGKLFKGLSASIHYCMFYVVMFFLILVS